MVADEEHSPQPVTAAVLLLRSVRDCRAKPPILLSLRRNEQVHPIAVSQFMWLVFRFGVSDNQSGKLHDGIYASKQDSTSQIPSKILSRYLGYYWSVLYQ